MMSDRMNPNPPSGGIFVENLKLAAWLRLNGARLLQRSLRPDQRIAYLFAASPDVDKLIARWHEKSEGEVTLSRFASLVSYEIRTALKMRRSSGLPLRLRGVSDSDHGQGPHRVGEP
jgi:hypothetical protein